MLYYGMALYGTHRQQLENVLKPEARQPRFHFGDPVAFDFNGPAGANPNRILPWILGNGDLERRSQFVQKETSIARDFLDPRRDSSAVFSVVGWIATETMVKTTCITSRKKSEKKHKRMLQKKMGNGFLVRCSKSPKGASLSKVLYECISTEGNITHRYSEYTGRNPTAPLGLFLVRAT